LPTVAAVRAGLDGALADRPTQEPRPRWRALARPARARERRDPRWGARPALASSDRP